MAQSINVMAFTEWLEHQSSKTLPVFLLYGNEPALLYLTQQSLHAYARQCSAEHLPIHIDQHFDWSSLSAYIQQESLFSCYRYIDVRVHSKINKDILQKILSMSTPQAQLILSFSFDHISWADKKDKYFQQLLLKTLPLVCDTPTIAMLKRWIRARPPFSVDTPETWIDSFLNLCHGEFSTAAQELSKLALIFPEGLPSEEALHTHIVTYRHDVLLDDVTPYVLGLETQHAPRLFTQLRQHGIPAQLVLWRIAEDIRQWLRCHAYLHRPMSLHYAYQQSKVFGKRQHLYGQALEKRSLASMQKALLYCLDIDRMIKGVPSEDTPSDPWQGFVQLCQITRENH